MVFSDDFRKKLNTLLALAVTVLAGLFVFLRFDIYYDLNDDLVIRDIVSGVYSGTPETRNMQMLYPLSFVLAVLYNVIPIIPWYGVMLGLAQAVCLFFIAQRSMDFCAKISGKILMAFTIMAIWLGMFSFRFVFLHYTVTVGILVGTALFRFMTNYSTDPDEVGFTQDTARVTKDDMQVGEFIRRNIINIILLVSAFLLRPEMALLLLPFIGIAFILKWAEEKPVFTRQNFEKFGSIFFIVIICCGFMWMVDNIAYSRTNWSNFKTFFDARTEIYDFTGIPNYEEHKSFYESLEITPEDYELLRNYNFALSENLDYEKLEALSEYAVSLQQKEITFEARMKNAIWSYMHLYISEAYRPMVWMNLVLGILILIAALAQKQLQIIWKMLLMICLRTIPWIYLYYRGRIVDRVTSPLLMVEMLVLLAFLLMEFGIVVEKQNGYRAELRRMRILSKWEERREDLVRVFPVVALVVTCAVAVLSVPNGYRKTLREFQNRELIRDYLEQVNGYMKEHEDQYYLIDVYSSTSAILSETGEAVNISKKVYGDINTDFGNYDMMGGWISKSPLYQEKLTYVKKHVLPANIEENQVDLTAFDVEVLNQLKSQSKLGYELIANPEHYKIMIRKDRDKSWLSRYYLSKNVWVKLEKVDVLEANAVADTMEVYEVRIVGTITEE